MITLNSDNLTIMNGTVNEEISVTGGNVVLKDVKMNREGRCVSVRGGEVTIDTGCELIGTGASATVAFFGTTDGSTNVTKLNVKGKIVNTYNYGDDDGQFAIAGNGNTKYGPCELNIKTGADISSTYGIAVYFPCSGDCNIEGGKVEGLTALNAKAGNINITGGELVGKGNWDWRYSFGGASETGDAIMLENIGYPKAGSLGPQVNITGNTKITSNHRQAVEVFYGERNTDGSDIPASHITLASPESEYRTKLVNYINSRVNIADTVIVSPALREELTAE